MARSFSRWLPGVLVLACGVGGWTLGKGRTDPRAEVTSEQKAAPKTSRSLARERSVSSVAPMSEFLAELSPDADEGKIWRIVQRLSPQEIRDAITEIAGKEKPGAYEAWLSALYYRWAEIDPMAALESAKQLKGEFLADEMGRAVLCSWMSRDAEGAYVALKKDKDFWHEARDMLVRTWNKDTVFENLKRFPDKEDAKTLLGAYCFQSAGDPESRAHILAALAENKDLTGREWGYSLLYRSWLYKDPVNALAAVPDKSVPWLHQQMLRDGLNAQPGPTLKWASAQGLRPGESMWQEAYRNWLVFEPETAHAWFADQVPVWNQQGDHRAVAEFINQEIDNAQATKNESSRQQLDARLAQQIELWRKHDPAAADAWLAAQQKKAAESPTR